MILLTGFGAYGIYLTNLSSEIVRNFKFDNERFQLAKKIIPVSWKQSIVSYKNILLNLRFKPDLVVLLGIHSSKQYRLERFGWNFKMGIDIEKKFKIGLIKIGLLPLIKTILNLNKILSVIKDKSDFCVSNYPGSYLCNYLYYWALYLSNKEYPVIFIHIPANGNLFESLRKIEIILKAILKTHFKEDL